MNLVSFSVFSSGQMSPVTLEFEYFEILTLPMPTNRHNVLHDDMHQPMACYACMATQYTRMDSMPERNQDTFST
jgi:hypothetical protein